ncbi:JAB domain-containing protein [Staphylococcus aureus]
MIKETCVFKGTLNSSIVHPREILVLRLEKMPMQSSQFILLFGDVTPSQRRYHNNNEVEECGLILRIDLLDHIIIGDNRFTKL